MMVVIAVIVLPAGPRSRVNADLDSRRVVCVAAVKHDSINDRGAPEEEGSLDGMVELMAIPRL